MRIYSGILICAFCFVVFISYKQPQTPIGFTTAVGYFKNDSDAFAAAALELKSSISFISHHKPASVIAARHSLKKCRLQFKKIEYFMEYFFKSNAVFYNGPPKYEIEEPYMEYQTPIGMQVIESLLYEKDVYLKKKELMEQAEALASSAQDINAFLYDFEANDQQILESIRLELIRIYTLGITGFDAPLLKTGMEESAVSLEAIQSSLHPYLKKKTGHADSVSFYLNNCIQFLKSNKNFDTFDRLLFLTRYALPLQKNLGLLITEMHLKLNTTGKILNYEAEHLFSPDAINVNAFPAANVAVTSSLATLGKKLFNETSLSGNNKISCATCHQPQKHFTDGLPKSIAFNGHSTVTRNAPSLLYAAFQYEQFWDGRAKSLEAQVKDVLTNSIEMNGNPLANIHQVQSDDKYALLFKNAFPEEQDSLATIDKVCAAIAAFIRTLNPRNAPFDKYIQGNRTAMTLPQVRGFNLFMGKAQCGTCHFAPLFNGLVPPLYHLSELEVLGTTKTDNFKKPETDVDKGRYNVFPIEFYKQAFKTPSVRNASATAPYMHNGSFKTLEKVVEFYNRGGANGLGLEVKNQTLSSTPLNLTPVEIHDLVSFMQALTDSIP